MRIQELICPERVSPCLAVDNKPLLLEKLGQLLSLAESGPACRAACDALSEREQQGSTGIGRGIAIPHGRLRGLSQAVGAFVTLKNEMDYGAIDHKPVKMVFALLVPENAENEHLRLLALLAGIFSNVETRQKLLQAMSAEEICQCMANAENRLSDTTS
ncbi:MAG: PTS sugar transporter subunit IIA [Pseudomonadota bacterium]